MNGPIDYNFVNQKRILQRFQIAEHIQPWSFIKENSTLCFTVTHNASHFERTSFGRGPSFIQAFLQVIEKKNEINALDTNSNCWNLSFQLAKGNFIVWKVFNNWTEDFSASATGHPEPSSKSLCKYLNPDLKAHKIFFLISFFTLFTIL